MAADSEPQQNAEKAKVFISYSRKDLAFADRLDTALRARGFEPLIDRSEIYAFEDWWKRIQALIAQADTIIFVLSPDGKRIVTASLDDTARVWDAATGKQIVVLRGHQDIVNSAEFSPDNRRIVTASSDNTVRVWDASTGEPIVVLRGHDDEVRSAAFSPSGNQIVSASYDKTARIWDARFAMMPAMQLVTEVCTRRLLDWSELSRDEMRLAGYPDSTPLIEVCAGVQ
jgi:WD40 repeat protein